MKTQNKSFIRVLKKTTINTPKPVRDLVVGEMLKRGGYSNGVKK
jgi:hypothetical protein